MTRQKPIIEFIIICQKYQSKLLAGKNIYLSKGVQLYNSILSFSKLYHRLARLMPRREADGVDVTRWELVMDDLVNQRVEQQVNRSVLIN